MSPDVPEGVIQWAFEGGVTVMLTLIGVMAGWVWIKNDRRSDEQDRRTDALENLVQEIRVSRAEDANKVTELRLHVSENYSGKQETQNSLARIHEKIEKLNDDVTEKIDDLRSDIREDIRNALAVTHRA
jgi:hypothetical protein